MNKPLKFSSKTHKLLWCSDLHMGHEPLWKDADPLWKSRGFTSIGEHDKWIRDEWYKLVDDDTIVFNLGDSVFMDPKGERFRQLTTWPGEQYLINGNHWSGQKQIYDGELASRGYDKATVPMLEKQKVFPLCHRNVTFLGDLVETYIDGIAVFMQHRAPYIWPDIGDGGFALCGHSHGKCIELNPDNVTQGRILDVGLDNAIKHTGTPFFAWDDIKRIMDKKPIIKRDHH